MKVAIVQDIIALGGRLSLLVEMIEILNKKNIVPDILSSQASFSEEQVYQSYSKRIQYNLIITHTFTINKLEETSHILYLLQIRKIIKKYDLIINSNNTLLFLPKGKNIISYVHFPRKYRIFNNIHLWPGEKEKLKFKTRIGRYLDHTIASIFHIFFTPPSHRILANSHFTKEAVLKAFNLAETEVKVLYPPVSFTKLSNNKPKKKWIISLGRFTQTKKQIEQILIARSLPDFTFIIAGFSPEDNPYLKKCQEIIQRESISNVELKTNLPFETVIEYLQESAFYLHTTWNEPFGISVVQSIAAGCVPIIPASGGQTEIVPNNTLQYKRFEEVPDIVKNSFPHLDSIHESLLNLAAQFSPEHFEQAFLNYLHLKS